MHKLRRRIRKHILIGKIIAAIEISVLDQAHLSGNTESRSGIASHLPQTVDAQATAMDGGRAENA
ncbi:MAG: hypothetical protein EA348_01175, partial [Pseudomonadaceae bacterium]